MCNTAGQCAALRFTLQSLQAEWPHHLFFSHAVFHSSKNRGTGANTSSLARCQSRYTKAKYSFFLKLAEVTGGKPTVTSILGLNFFSLSSY